MAPMIDMVFLLLVFFMTASAMSQAGTKLEVDLPDSTAAQVAQDFSNRLIISIGKEGDFFLGTSSLSETELKSTLEAFRKETPEARLTIRAAKTTPFSYVKQCMGIAAAAGIDDYLYATYQSQGS